MSKFDKNFDKLFNIVPTEPEYDENTDLQEYNPSGISTTQSELSTLLDEDLRTDYEKTRESIDTLINKGTEAIDDMLSIARETEKARDFEVVGNMIKTVVDASKELLAIQKQMRDITGKTESSRTTNIKQAVFVGTTAELLRTENSKIIDQ